MSLSRQIMVRRLSEPHVIAAPATLSNSRGTIPRASRYPMVRFMIVFVLMIAGSAIAMVSLGRYIPDEGVDKGILARTKTQPSKESASAVKLNHSKADDNHNPSSVETTKPSRTKNPQRIRARNPDKVRLAAVDEHLPAQRVRFNPIAGGDSGVLAKDSSALAAQDKFTTRGATFDASVSRQQGIVLSLHEKMLALGVSLIRELRCLGNHELIQVYHCLPDELSMKAKQRLLQVDDRLEVIDVCSYHIASGSMDMALAKTFQSWWLKPLALHHTDVKEILLLDADDLLLMNPALVRNSGMYQSTGTTFFYDRPVKCEIYLSKRVFTRPPKPYLHHLLENFDYAAFGISHNSSSQPSQRLLDSLVYNGSSCHEQDSSMIAVDKSRAGRALDILWWLITKERLRFEFSWGDKESFWLAYELAHQPYAFSPWGTSVISSSPNRDMENHPDTLCGSIAQYFPDESTSTAAQLLYINGRALLDPHTHDTNKHKRVGAHLLHNVHPTHVTPRHTRRERRRSKLPTECLIGLGATQLPAGFAHQLWRRRTMYIAVELDIDSSWTLQCNLRERVPEG